MDTHYEIARGFAAAENLFTYLRKRAQVEGVECDESIWRIMADGHLAGIRLFFGVKVDDNGQMLRDAQEPYQGFFQNHLIENGKQFQPDISYCLSLAKEYEIKQRMIGTSFRNPAPPKLLN
jgi:hypothetical protein